MSLDLYITDEPLGYTYPGAVAVSPWLWFAAVVVLFVLPVVVYLIMTWHLLTTPTVRRCSKR